MNLTDKQLNLLGKRVWIVTPKINAATKIRVLMDPTPVLFLREENTKPANTWTFDPEQLEPADGEGTADKPVDFIYKGKLTVF